MAFVRKKTFSWREYYYLVESYREGDKVRQRVIKYLGKEKPTDSEVRKLVRK